MLALVGEQPLDAITATMVVERAGTGYATFFRHYRSTRDLLMDLADTAISELIALLTPAIQAGEGQHAMRLLAGYVEERAAFFRALLSGAGDAIRHELARRVLAQAAAAPPLPGTWLPPDLALLHITGAVITVVGWWLDQEPPLPAGQAAAILDRLAIAPVLGPPEPP